MNNMNNHIDKTYILYVLDKLNTTAYQIAKKTGVSNQALSDAKLFKTNLNWRTISQIEKYTGLEFKSSEHIAYSINFYNENIDLFE